MSTLAAQVRPCLFNQPTVATHQLFKSKSRILGHGRTVTQTARHSALDINNKLADALEQAKHVIRENVRDLDDHRRHDLVKKFTELLCPDDWDEGDEMLKVGSVRTLVRALIALDAQIGALTLTRSGHVVRTWSEDGKTLRLEALPDANVAWSLLKRVDDRIEVRDHPSDTISNMRVALQD